MSSSSVVVVVAVVVVVVVVIKRDFKTRKITEVCCEGAHSNVENKSLKQNSFRHQSEVSKCQIGVAEQRR